jgi:hypothetical protein
VKSPVRLKPIFLKQFADSPPWEKISCRSHMWNGLWYTWKSPFMILCKLELIVDQHGSKQFSSHAEFSPSVLGHTDTEFYRWHSSILCEEWPRVKPAYGKARDCNTDRTVGTSHCRLAFLSVTTNINNFYIETIENLRFLHVCICTKLIRTPRIII